MVKISAVCPHSEAAKAKIAAGDILKSINGNLINDVLDYRFYITDSVVALCFLHNEHEENCIIKKSEYSDIGLEFDGYLMDAKKSCRNKCIFCFIDQNPKGMRESIYFKDDDERLSFLQGNYVTLTNLNESDIQRIIKMKISPINVSVHTTNPDLRIKMTNNRFAGESLRFLKMLSDANIELNLQFVLCKGINDGDELISSLEYIKKLKSVASAAVVPCGLTGYRDGLFKLEPFDKKSACAVVETVEKFNAEYRKTSGSGVVFASDEFYLISQKDLPNDEYYDGYLQLENGIGMITNLKTEFFDELKYTDSALPGKISIATGEAAYPHIKELATAFTLKFPRCEIEVYAIKNNFFGGSVTVSGLVTGQDIKEQLSGKNLGKKLLIPCNMLKSDEPIFLDNTSLTELENYLNIKICVVGKDGAELVKSMK